ncbi:translocation/assembly module TamB domain-containing protein [Luteimonas aquatica]|uniref:translocation/assembly module TamB domain-containing protein n=1 Tax=Luteimonas aquatica TaxID=450364 RepID=UPI001F5AD6E9|nr:translocation/assembly module TamB domain-containing protein [Luteimonas aquatica]
MTQTSAPAPDPTPEEREARIAELRALRRARMRKLALRTALAFMVLALLLVFALYWLLATLGGRDFLMAQIVARLPAGTQLTWDKAEGPVTGSLALSGLRFEMKSCPDKDGQPVPYGQCAKPDTLVFTARRVVIDPDIRPLLGKLLRLDALDIEGATLELPKSDEPFELPRWPEVLPRIDLPLALQADRIRIDGFKVTQAGQSLIDVRTARGGIDARQGELHVEHLVVDSDRGHFAVHGDYAPDDDYRMSLTASALLPAPPARTRPRIGLAARGDLSRLDIAVSGNVPDKLRALLTLRGKDRPRWQFSAASNALDPGLLAGSGEPGTPLSFDIRAEGLGGEADLRGKLRQGDLDLVLQPSKVKLEEQVLEFKPLAVDVFGGHIVARGRGDFSEPEAASFKFSVNANGLSFGGGPQAAKGAAPEPVIGANADFGIAGTSQAWAAVGKAVLTRENQRATVDFDGRGDTEKLLLKSLRAAMPTGTLDAKGQVGWTPSLSWEIDAALDGFDPGYFARDFKGAVNGSLASRGRTRDDGGLEVEVDAERLGGTLRGRKLGGRAAFAMHGPATGKTQTDFDGEIALSLGDSRIDAKGKVGNALAVDAKLAPLQLADLLPGSAGALRGTLRLTGTRTAPNLDADLSGSGLKYQDYTAASLSVKGQIPWQGANGSLAVTAQGVNAGIALASLRADARGAIENLQFDASAQGQAGGGFSTLALGGHVQRNRNGNWQGTLVSLQLAPEKGAPWRLQSPARFAQNGNRWTLSESCFSSGPGALCANADWPQQGVHLRGNGLPLTLATPYLPTREDGRPWILRGEIAIEGQVRPAGNAFQGNLRVSSPGGGLRMSERARNEVISYENLSLDGSFDARQLRATLGSSFNGGGRVDAHVETGWDAYSPLAGTISVNTAQLTWLELFSPDIVEPTGKLDGRITLSGTRSQPALGGQAQLSDFSTELPALGILLQQGNVRLDALADGSARINGSIRSGEGTLNIDGSLGWQGDDTPLQLQLRGNNVLVSDTRDLRAVANPDITVRYAARQPLNVTGTVTVPNAMIDLERLDQGVSASPDVVVLDPEDPEDTGDSPLELDLTLAMGEDVKLKGFGLDGTLGGKLRVRARPGREMTGSGQLDVGGKYEAYGQKLQITRGALSWSNGPVSDPLLNIRAERKIEAESITAGIDVTGRASQPQANVWTDPATDDSEALSYLALGRSTSRLSSDESNQLSAASAALSAGGSVLASQIGSKIGLSDAGISDSRALGGSVLGVGKQLSPRLYVGFGVSLLGTGQVLTLKYLLSKGFDIEIESSTLENRGSINWRKEK